ncbi:MAG: hypothetical protein FWD94_08480 [Treponema sp.]|nr:hypothetical protein [Treponema sp.]
MLKKCIVIALLHLMNISNVHADSFGNVVLIDELGSSAFINVSYTITRSNGNSVNGLSDSAGWINFTQEAANEPVLLTLDFGGDDWDWSEEFDDSAPESLNALYLDRGFIVLDVAVDAFTRHAAVELDGTENYILIVSLPVARFSM